MWRKVIDVKEPTSKLSETLEQILAWRKANHSILPGGFTSRKVYLDKHRFNLFYSEPRHLRRNTVLLQQYGIIDPGSPKYYEYPAPELNNKQLKIISEKDYQFLTPKEQFQTNRACFINPNELTTSVYLSGYKGAPQKFSIGANFAPLGHNHFVAWTVPQESADGELTLRQAYQGINQLYWIDDLLTKLNDPEYRLFFSAIGAGATSYTQHYQFLQEKFPAFAHLSYYYPNSGSEIIYTSKHAWPFNGFLARYDSQSKETVLTGLTRLIKHWLRQKPNNTFNLLAQLRPDGTREIYFAKRKYGLNYMQGMSNMFGGYEVAGNIVMEDPREYQSFPGKVRYLAWEHR
ncbi:hypothetical protein RDn1_011 [Candidatus Termititenax dinenymphae]|uniref:Uncharacterized protein n=1 Tax=Candidatus Termititenax dinenymphae TaxID=2218523 RepID=A0A388TJW4_9BACT|nr:hypothetical protein RDn1_011 [Candidatus Termititenax dinenymphae]